MRKVWRRVAPSLRRTATAVALASGCTPPAEEERWIGEYVTLTSSDGLNPCGGTLDFYDRFVPSIYRYWTGIEPLDLHVTLDLRRGPEADSGHLGGADGNGRQGWSAAETSSLHELVHLAVFWDDGVSAPSLTEGIAEALGAGFRSTRWWPTYHPVETFFFDSADDFTGDDYQPSGLVVAFLIRRYGVAKVREAYRAIPYDATSEQIEDGLVQVFGDDLYDAFAEFEDADPCPLQVWECAGEVLEARTLPIIIDRDPNCEAPGTLGAIADGDETWFAEHLFTLDVEPGTTLYVEASDNAYLTFERCFSACDDLPFPTMWTVDPDDEPMQAPAPGRYIVSIRPSDDSAPFSATIEALSP